MEPYEYLSVLAHFAWIGNQFFFPRMKSFHTRNVKWLPIRPDKKKSRRNNRFARQHFSFRGLAGSRFKIISEFSTTAKPSRIKMRSRCHGAKLGITQSLLLAVISYHSNTIKETKKSEIEWAPTYHAALK